MANNAGIKIDPDTMAKYLNLIESNKANESTPFTSPIRFSIW